MFPRVLATSRYLVLIAVLATFVASASLMIFGAATVVRVILETISRPDLTENGAKHLSIVFIELIDAFLLATVLYIVSAGLYELFVGPLHLPPWLIITNLDDLKSKLVGVTVVLLAVSFLGDAAEEESGLELFFTGAGIAVVILALGLFSRLSNHETATAHSTQPLSRSNAPAEPPDKPVTNL
jgi:uncharacterized membrane protein YqhA